MTRRLSLQLAFGVVTIWIAFTCSFRVPFQASIDVVCLLIATNAFLGFAIGFIGQMMARMIDATLERNE